MRHSIVGRTLAGAALALAATGLRSLDAAGGPDGRSSTSQQINQQLPIVTGPRGQPVHQRARRLSIARVDDARRPASGTSTS